MFINVTETLVNQKTNSMFRSLASVSSFLIIFSQIEAYVSRIDLYITEEYINGTYDSCKNVQFPSTGQLALDLMCGEFGSAKCSAVNWFNYFGDSSKEVVPFQADYKVYKSTEKVNGFTPLNPPVVPCSESIDVSWKILAKNHDVNGNFC
jgi:hypothetical protein